MFYQLDVIISVKNKFFKFCVARYLGSKNKYFFDFPISISVEFLIYYIFRFFVSEDPFVEICKKF